MKLQGPVGVEIKISITDGSVNGVATIGMAKGTYPTSDELREAVAKFEREEMPDGFRLMTKREWFDTICPPQREEDEYGEVHTMRYALPGGREWDT